MSDTPEKPTKSDTVSPANDAAGAKPESVEAEPILIDEIESKELEELVNISHPVLLRAPRIKDLLESPDPPSRFMTYLSFAFGFMAVACTATLVMKYLEYRAANRQVVIEEPKDRLEKIITESLGEFRLILKGAESPNDGELRVDMVAECSTAEACVYLKEHLPQARDIVIPVLVNTRREELLNPESKNLIRRRIAEQLNSLPMKGKVIQILFTDLTIEDAPDR